MKSIRSLTPAILSGMMAGLAWQYPSLALLMWIALVPFFHSLIRQPRSRLQTWIYGFCFGMVYYGIYFSALWGLYPMDWLGISPGVSFWTLLAALILFSSIQAFWTGFAALLTAGLRPNLLRQGFGAACAWTLAEFCQSLSPLGFTGAHLGVSLYAYPSMIQGASFWGALWVSTLIILVNSFLACALPSSFRKPGRSLSCQYHYLILALLVFGGNLLAGGLLLSHPSEYDEAPIATALIQGGLSSTRKWDAEYLEFCRHQYESLTLEAASRRPALIIWPETAVPVQWTANSDLDRMLRQAANTSQAQLLAGIFYDNYNSIILIKPDQSMMQLYHKQRLAPFGEFLPFKKYLQPFLTWLEGGKAQYFTLQAGSTMPLLQTVAGPTGSLICFEAMFFDLARNQVLAGAESLVVSTNDSWFDGTSLQSSLLGQSVFRAVENGRFVARASSTGISAIIDDHGRILGLQPAESSGVLTGAIVPRRPLTFFTKHGYWTITSSLLLFLFLLMTNKK